MSKFTARLCEFCNADEDAQVLHCSSSQRRGVEPDMAGAQPPGLKAAPAVIFFFLFFSDAEILVAGMLRPRLKGAARTGVVAAERRRLVAMITKSTCVPVVAVNGLYLYPACFLVGLC